MDLAARYPKARRTGFGDSPALSARLLGLIRNGRKTATCSAMRDSQAEGEPIPVPGEILIVEDWDGNPALAYRVTWVRVLPFDQVPEDVALAEGEGDFAVWRQAHQAFFARNGGFDPAMPVICERFVLVADDEESAEVSPCSRKS